MMKEAGYKNPMQVPRLKMIVLNIGAGEAVSNAKVLEGATSDLSLITGQRPVITRAKKSIAAFRLRAGMPVGVRVTLRGERMYEFFDRLVSAVLPRMRDFQGVPKDAFDGRGNYTLGLKEQIIFPEVDYDKVDKIRGLQVSIVTTARTNEEAKRFLELMGIPFSRQ
jgi:large subunit ribosomal protein L5